MAINYNPAKNIAIQITKQSISQSFISNIWNFILFLQYRTRKLITIMIEHEYQFRVTYPDTDKMGTMHHANYVKHYEAARWELLRSIGIPYQSMEIEGIMCPVISMNFKFLKTTSYDELLTVRTRLKRIKGVRMLFCYDLYNEKNELINSAETEVAFVGVNNWKPCSAPLSLINAIEKHTKVAI